MGGQGIASIDDLQRVLARTVAGKPVTITVIRHGGHRHVIEVTPIQD
jgi:S1-C subfamily serine protease